MERKGLETVVSYMGLATFREQDAKQNMGSVTYEITSEYAAGDVGQTVAVQKRVGHGNFNGTQVEMPWVG